jgi:cytochrome c peroxidase
VVIGYALSPRPEWSQPELAILRSLWIGNLGRAPADPSNAVAEDPRADALAHGVGTTDGTTLPLAGTQYTAFLFWDGRKDSQWAQAPGPFESAVEHGGSRGQYAHTLESFYKEEYEALFGALPTNLSEVPSHAGPVADAGARGAWDASQMLIATR